MCRAWPVWHRNCTFVVSCSERRAVEIMRGTASSRAMVYYGKPLLRSSYGMNALEMCLSIHRTALSALVRSESPVTAEPTLSASPPPSFGLCREACTL